MVLYHDDILERLPKITDRSIDLIFTSPPYWKGFSYESYFNSYLQYINWCRKWIKNIKSKLKDDGFFLLNIANDSETTIKAYELLNICIEEGWKLHDTIIWYRTNSQPFNTNRNLTNQYEFIFLLRHNSSNVNINKDKKLLDKYNNVFDVKNIGNVWKIPFKILKNSKLKKVSKNSTGHSGYPPILCNLVLDLFSNENDTILDCFAGNCVLGISCKEMNRKFIGIEKDHNIFKNSNDRLNSNLPQIQ